MAASVAWQLFIVFAPALFFAVTGVAATVHAARQFARRRRWGNDDEPRCGRCGYIIRAGASRTCPECGSDLAAVGVFTASTRPRSFPHLLLWFLSVAAVVLAFYAGPWLAAQTPWGWRFYAYCLLDTSQYSQAAGVTEGTFNLDMRGVGRGWSHEVARFHIDYKIPRKTDGWLRLEIAPNGSAGRLSGHESLVGTAPQWEPLDARLYDRLVRAAGFDPSAGEGARLVEAIDQHAQRMLRKDWYMLSTGGRGTGHVLNAVMYSPRDGAALVAGVAIWAIVVAAACLLLARRHRRRRARATAASRDLLDSLALRA